MDIVLVSARRGADRLAVHHAGAASLARDLAGAGHHVRWLCPVPPGSVTPAAPHRSVNITAVTSPPPDFRAVAFGMADVPTETALSFAIRAALPDVVHILGFGGVTSATLPWVADRLGVPVVLSADAAEVLCHRGTLIDEQGRECRAFADSQRCAACCLTPFADGLSTAQARRARLWRWAGSWSPYPKPVDFRNRLDLQLGGMMSAAAILVADDEQRELLESAGVRAAVLRVCRETSAAATVAVYRSVAVTPRP